MKNTLLLVLICIVSMATQAQSVSITGKNITYAGTKLTVKTYADPFTRTQQPLCSNIVASDGTFSLKINLQQTKLIFIPLGIYTGYIFAEPGKKYQIKLPPRKTISPQQELNPFFRPEELLLGITNNRKEELNTLIRRFDDELDSFINQNFNSIYKKGGKSPGKLYTQEMHKKYAIYKTPFFQDYIKYRFGILEYLSSPNAFGQIENKYFKDQRILLHNPAYISLFIKLYDNFLTCYLSRKESSSLAKALNSNETYNSLCKILNKYPNYSNPQFRNLILLKGLWDGWNSKVYSKKQLLDIIGEIQKYTTNYSLKKTAKNIVKKITFLQKGSPAPTFKINFKEKDYSLKRFKGHYLYLHFDHSRNKSFSTNIALMQKLYDQFGKQIKFLSIVIGDESESLITKSTATWPIIPLKAPKQLISEYGIRVYPTYFLIDPRGNILNAPAPSPNENIHNQFIEISRQIQRDEYHNKRNK